MSRKKVAYFEILGERYPIYNGMNIIGRDLEASIIVKNLKISKKHAIISVVGNKHYITDFKSSNGCALENEALIPLKFYDIQDKSNIVLGDIAGIYHIETSPVTESQDELFLKPNVPKHIRFAPTQQLIEIPKADTSLNDSHFAATQLINEDIPSITTNNSNFISQIHNTSQNNKTNDSKEIVFCDESIEEKFNESFKEKPQESEFEVPCTQECFTRNQNNSFNDSTIIPATQDASFPNGFHIKDIANQDDSQDATQIENYDSDHTEVEIEPVPNIQISIKDVSSTPLQEPTNPSDSTNILSDDDDIDLYENNDFNPEMTSTEMQDHCLPSMNSTKASSCANEFEKNINTTDNSLTSNKLCESNVDINKSCDPETIPETEEYDFIPETQDFENIQSANVQPTIAEEKSKDQHPTSTTVPEKEPNIITNQQNERNSTFREEDDVFFIGSTQDILNPTNKTDQQNIPKFQFKPPPASAKEIPDTDNNKFDAPTEVLEIPEQNFDIRRSSTPKTKQDDRNKSLADEDDMYFVGSTQDILNNSVEIKGNTSEYYLDEVNEGIPDMPCFEVEIDQERFTETENNQNKINSQEGKENSSRTKTMNLEQKSDENVKVVDFSAPTQAFNLKNSSITNNEQILAKSAANKLAETIFSSKTQIREGHNISDKSASSLSTNLAENNRNIEVDFDRPTQISPLEAQKQSEARKEFTGSKIADFSAPTQKLPTNLNQSNLFLAPTQDLLPNDSTKSNQINVSKDDDVFMAPTQELSYESVQNIQNRKKSTDSNDSDIVVKKKRPKLIKETQENTNSDSDSEISYKRKKCLPLPETQQSQQITENQNTLSGIIKNCANDSAVISDLEGTQESFHLVISNSSINVSGRSSSTPNKGETQLELNLPTEKEYFASQNNRPQNPLAQVLEEKQAEATDSTKYKTKRFIYDLEPTQILDEKLDTTAEIPSSDSDDYDDFCEMETQAIDEMDLSSGGENRSNRDTPKGKSKTDSVFAKPIAPNNQKSKASSTSAENTETKQKDKTKCVDDDTTVEQPSLNEQKKKSKRKVSKKNEASVQAKENPELSPSKVMIIDLTGDSQAENLEEQDIVPKNLQEECPKVKKRISFEENPIENDKNPKRSKSTRNKPTTSSKTFTTTELKKDDKKLEISIKEIVVDPSGTSTSKAGPSTESIRNVITSGTAKPEEEERVQGRTRNSSENKETGTKSSNSKQLVENDFGTKRTRGKSAVEEKKEDSSEKQSDNSSNRELNEGKEAQSSSRSTRKASVPKEIPPKEANAETRKEAASSSRNSRKASVPKDIPPNLEDIAETRKEVPNTSRRTRNASVPKEIIEENAKTRKGANKSSKRASETNIEENTEMRKKVPTSSRRTRNASVPKEIPPNIEENAETTKETPSSSRTTRASIPKDIPPNLENAEVKTENETTTKASTKSSRNTRNSEPKEIDKPKEVIEETKNSRSSRGKSFTKDIPTTAVKEATTENVPEIKRGRGRPSKSTEPSSSAVKRSTRGSSVTNEDITESKSSKRKTLSTIEEGQPSTSSNPTEPSSSKRSTRGSSITKEDITEPKVSRRKKLSTIKEINQPGTSKTEEAEGQIEELKPHRLSIGKIENIEDIPLTKDEVPLEKRKQVKKSEKKINSKEEGEEKEEVDPKSKEKTQNTRRKTKPAEEREKKEEVDPKSKEKAQNTRRKAKSDSLPSAEEIPTKRAKISESEDLDLTTQSTTSSSSRRELRIRHKVVFTMLDDTNLEATVGRLGGKLVDSSQECTVLVTSKISRSLKFLVAVSLGKPIVGPDWVRACGHAHKFLDPWDYILRDQETERKLNFKLKDAIEKGSKTKMFEEYTFLILVNKNFDVIKTVIEACGGKCVTKVPNNSEKIFRIISYPEDKNKYRKYLKQTPPVAVVGAEAIFAGALQQINILEEHLLTL